MYDTKHLHEICSEFTMLLVDDEESAREQVYGILKLFFKTVDVAKDGEEALALYEKERHDLIVTDLTMPKMSGFELIAGVRKIYDKQKIIVISAHKESSVIVKAITYSVDGYLLKPIEAMQMFQTIEKVAHLLQLELENRHYQQSLETKISTQEKELHEQNRYDALTKLPNKQTLESDFQEGNFSDIIFINIDNFSHINSTYGYEGGDLLLVKVSEYLQEILNLELYKGNADEFFIVIRDKHQDEVFQLAKFIQHKIYMKHFNIDSNSVRITFSMAIISTEGESVLPYLQAQLAIADARKIHKNAIGFYDKLSITQDFNQQMHEWSNKVKLALDFDLFVPYYQPIVHMKSNHSQKYECLARILENNQPISPFYFIEPARNAGIVTEITKRMILKSFEMFQGKNSSFSINITDDDFKEEYLKTYLLEKCQEYNIKPNQVILEVLENISDYDASHAISQIDELKSLGFKISIDDFGAESSNFARLQKLQVDFLKIDGSFIKDVAFNYNSRVVVETMIYYAKKLNIETIAEYVHDETTYNIVKELGIDYAQGYYISEPKKGTE